MKKDSIDFIIHDNTTIRIKGGKSRNTVGFVQQNIM